MPTSFRCMLKPCTAALAAVLVLAGCSTVETQSFQVQRGGNVESAQVATDADFSKYKRLVAEEMGIFFPQNVSIPEQDVRRIRAIFRRAFIAELDGYDISQEPGPDAMTVQASLIDLRQSGSVPPMRRDIAEIATPGKLVFLMEMRDSKTNRILARAGDSASAPAFATGGRASTDWEAVEAAAKRWANLFRQFLDQNLSR